MNWTAIAVAIVALLLLFVGIFYTGTVWQRSHQDQQFQDSLAVLNSISKLKMSRIEFLEKVVRSRDVELSETSAVLTQKEMDLMRQRGAMSKLRGIVDSLEREMAEWELDSTTQVNLPVARLDILDTTSATVNDTTVRVIVNYGSLFNFADMTWRNSFCKILPFSLPVKMEHVTESYSPPLFGGVWFSISGFKQYRAQFASSDLLIATARIGFEWNVGSETVLETDPLAINWSTHLPEYGFRLGLRKKLW